MEMRPGLNNFMNYVKKNLKGIKLWKENATALDSFRTLINLYLST